MLIFLGNDTIQTGPSLAVEAIPRFVRSKITLLCILHNKSGYLLNCCDLLQPLHASLQDQKFHSHFPFVTVQVGRLLSCCPELFHTKLLCLCLFSSPFPQFARTAPTHLLLGSLYSNAIRTFSFPCWSPGEIKHRISSFKYHTLLLMLTELLLLMGT